MGYMRRGGETRKAFERIEDDFKVEDHHKAEEFADITGAPPALYLRLKELFKEKRFHEKEAEEINQRIHNICANCENEQERLRAEQERLKAE